ncbi:MULTISPECIES: DUF3561 family protein [Rahnella]|jgi:hypothetical protein|uniref:DUF3561 family protein n=1 Tax=Rahnella sp. (strain Y9602) TaxID=2703885 RepID=A0A0H3F538_RAHSY|nr:MULTISPECIES: DUF3561 family protein [Rahnella]AFE56888.1 hypothetical protein Q7S_03125 [Rahnella aquatilis HX2]AYA05661.1 DUF3561 family protein [Rahnella aquatilis]ADW72306.1 hypothetical protein Rahaq_0679 [Rahnella aceris]AZP40902.1 DUF3561 family protein [Rahnella aquatilis]AZP45243.1 DUF3561 family protein [Rahnella aquatilis]
MQALFSRLVSRNRVDRTGEITPRTRVPIPETDSADTEDPSYSMQGGFIGFVFYWLAFAIPFLVYGSNTLFFLLYTWPFFLALMPVSVLIGIAFSTFFGGGWFKTSLASAVCVIGMFWTVFSFLSGW